MKTWSVLLAGISLALAACGGSLGDNLDGATLEITPGTSTLTVRNGAAAQQAFVAQVRFADNSTQIVTADTVFSIDRFALGSFSADTFTAPGTAGGEGVVLGAYMGISGQATVTVNVETTRVVDPASPDAPSWFETATDDPARAPVIVYPTTQTMVPPNLGDFDVHWNDVGGNDLFEVTISTNNLDLRVYLSGVPNAGNWIAYAASEWAIVQASHRGESINVFVRALLTTAPQTAGTSEAIVVRLTDEDVEGGIYYWATASGSGPEGIYRHDMARPGQPAEQFYTTGQSPGGRCVACHVLSREGDRMLITYDGGNGAASLVDVATRTELLAIDGTFAWNFATFEPGGERFLSVSSGVMTLRSSADGSVVATVPNTGYATHPDFSPAGDAIVYTQASAPTQDWFFTGGRIITQSFDAPSGTFGGPAVLVPASAQNNYYPSWSPDGQWVLFNKSSEDAYDDASAELWVVRSDGSSEPVKVDAPNVAAGLTNSWARWAPFSQTLGTAQEPLFWMTFSSKRVFGVRLAAGSPQIWMAPFFPDRANNALDPSAPAFRLPFQDLSGKNHIAQWTEQVIPVQ